MPGVGLEKKLFENQWQQQKGGGWLMSEKFALARLLLFLLTLKTSYLLLFLKAKTEIEEED